MKGWQSKPMSNQNKSIESKTARKINEIHLLINHSFELKWFNTVILPSKTMKEHLDELSYMLEQDFEESKKIKELRADILQQARDEADGIIHRAKKQIEEQDLIEQARNYAKQIVGAAYKEAESITDEAKQARHQMLLETYTTLDSVYAQTQKDLSTAVDDLRDQLAEGDQTVVSGRSRMHSELERISKQYQE